MLQYAQMRNNSVLSITIFNHFRVVQVPNALTLRAGINMVCSNRPSEVHYAWIHRTSFGPLMVT